MQVNRLYYGDNLEWMQEWPDECVDLVYLDPPFNSKADYNILYGVEQGGSPAQVQAFTDTWRWGDQACKDRDLALNCPGRLPEIIRSLEMMLKPSGMLAYLCHLAPRLWHLRRLLKDTGSLYLHCDDTADRYVGVLLDGVFGARNRRNTIHWKRTSAHNNARRFGRTSDTVYFYAKSGERVRWHGSFKILDEEYLRKFYRHRDERGRYMLDNLKSPGPQGYWYDFHGHRGPWRYPEPKMKLLEASGQLHLPQRGGVPRYRRYLKTEQQPVQDIWTDIPPIGSHARERLGYPTQKPEALLRRIIEASSNKGDLILDPYCGCGTAVHVACELERNYIGIDITHLAIAVIEHRFAQRLGRKIEVEGKPRDLDAARELFQRNPFEFEAWAVSLLGMMPNEHQRGDRGIDGRGYAIDGEHRRLVLAQVKGGNRIGSPSVRDLRGTIDREQAALGVLVVMGGDNLTGAAREELDRTLVRIGESIYPRMQVLSIRDLLDGLRPCLPPLTSFYRHKMQLLPDLLGYP